MEGGGELDRSAVVQSLQLGNPKEDVIRTLRELSYQGEDGAGQAVFAADVAGVLAQRREPEVVVAALDALAGMGQEAAWYAEIVAPHLDSEHRAVRRAAASTLGAFAEASAPHLPRLLACIKDVAEEVRAAAILAVAQVGPDHDGVDSQVSGLAGDPSPVVAAAACQALGLMGAKGEARADLLGEKLSDPQLRYAALTALSNFGPGAVRSHVEKLIALGLTDRDCLTRQLAATVLGSAGEVALESVERLLSLLGDERPGVRCAAALAFGHIGEEARPHAGAVAALLGDEAEDTSELHLQIGGGVPRLPPELRRPACAALRALGLMGASDFTRDCARGLGDESYEVRLCALDCMSHFGAAARALSTEIAACLEDSTYVVRVRACEVIGALGAEDALTSLPELFGDKSPAVKVAALHALSTSPQVAETFSSDVAKCMSDPLPAVKAAAVMLLGRLGETGRCYASAVGTMLNDPDIYVRSAACEALGRMGPYGAAFAEEIADCLATDSPMLQQSAQAALDEFSSFSGAAGPAKVYMIEQDAHDHE